MRRINELLDTPEPVQLINFDSDEIEGWLEIDGIQYLVQMYIEETDVENRYTAIVMFWAWSYEYRNWTDRITGTGNAPLVFSSVMNFCLEMLTELEIRGYEVVTLRFDGYEPSRKRLYQMIAKKAIELTDFDRWKQVGTVFLIY